MASPRQTILAWETADTDKVVGIPRKYVDRLQEHFDIVWQKDAEDNAELCSKVEGAIVTADRPLQVLFDRPEWFPRLRVVVTLSAGLDHLDVTALRDRGIRLAATASFADAVAEMALTLLLSLTRGLSIKTRTMSDPSLRQSRMLWDDPGVLGSTVGLVGFGRIGTRIAQLLVPHRCTLMYYDPAVHRSNSTTDQGAGVTRCTDLHQMLHDSDCVIVACSLTEETTGLIGEREFSAMKQSATFINVARGKIVDTDALVKALRTGKLLGAGLDVVHPDWLPLDHPLLTMDNVILLPHCAASTRQSMDFAFKSMISNLLIGLRGEVMPKQVDL